MPAHVHRTCKQRACMGAHAHAVAAAPAIAVIACFFISRWLQSFPTHRGWLQDGWLAERLQQIRICGNGILLFAAHDAHLARLLPPMVHLRVEKRPCAAKAAVRTRNAGWGGPRPSPAAEPREARHAREERPGRSWRPLQAPAARGAPGGAASRAPGSALHRPRRAAGPR